MANWRRIRGSKLSILKIHLLERTFGFGMLVGRICLNWDGNGTTGTKFEGNKH